MKSFSRVVVAFGLCVLASGCALASKSDVLDIRYFTPYAQKTRLSSASPAAAKEMPALRLGRVTSGTHLRTRMVHRTAAGEVTFDEQRRWTERPEVFVRQELERELFEERGFRRELTTGAPTLDVEVLAFEELKLRGGSAARVQLRMVLHDDEKVMSEETLTVDRPVGGRGAVEDLVTATSDALDASASAIADRITAKLAPPPAADSP